jgi:hypothetical protein
MAFFSDKFGIKEVADVAFYKVGDIIYNSANGKVTARALKTGETEVKPVLVFNTLKTSSLEFTGETAEARGGKGNAVLLSWDHSREATLTLEDALLSADSLRAMLSNSGFEGDGDGASQDFQSTVISIDANGFPDTYTVVGKTFARGTDGRDHLLTFLVFKAKVSSEANLEMTADGDPSTLSMTLKVLRCENNEKGMGCKDGDMVKLIIDEKTDGTTFDMTFPTTTK